MPRFSPHRLRELRLAKGISQTELAARVGRSYNTIRSYESGVRNPPNMAIAELADALEASILELFDASRAS